MFLFLITELSLFSSDIQPTFSSSQRNKNIHFQLYKVVFLFILWIVGFCFKHCNLDLFCLEEFCCTATYFTVPSEQYIFEDNPWCLKVLPLVTYTHSVLPVGETINLRVLTGMTLMARRKFPCPAWLKMLKKNKKIKDVYSWKSSRCKNHEFSEQQ